MKRLNHRKMIKKAGFISFPDAVERLAMATATSEWKISEYVDYLPCSIAVDPKSKRMRPIRSVLYRVGRGYRLSSETLPALKKNEVKAFREHRSHYTNCAKDLIARIADKRITAIAAIPYVPYIQLDGTNDNLLTSQFETLCATGYIAYMLPDGELYYGLVSLRESDLAKFIKGELATITRSTFCKVTPTVEQAHVEFIRRLIAFVRSAEGKEAQKGVLPQFIVEDFKLDVVRKAIGEIASNPELGKLGVAPSSLRRIVMTSVQGEPYFPSKSGGKTNPKRREVGKSFINMLSHSIISEQPGDESEDDEDAQVTSKP